MITNPIHSSCAAALATLLLLCGCDPAATLNDDDTMGDDDDVTAEIEGDEAGECDDGVDNDQDGFTDCDDPGCEAATACTGDDDDATSDDDDDATSDDDDDATSDDDDDATSDDDDDATSDDDDDATGDDDDDATADDDDTTGDDDDSTGTDDDGDGWTVQAGDCDDSDPAVHPGAAEACDGVDTDCDGSPGADEEDLDGDGWMVCENDCDDSDAALTPADVDADGYSTCQGDCDDTDATLTPVDADMDGYSTCFGDCDDSDADRSPGATEICDGLDNDCDALIDDDDASVVGLTLWYDDSDGDGYGDPAVTYLRCFAPPDTVDNDDDCDDNDASMHPGDLDGDGYSPCDGDCDDADGSLNLTDADGDGWDTCAGDCNDAVGAVHPGAVEVCDGFLDNDCDGHDDSQEIDADGDGTTPCDGDCDDTDPSMHPNDGDGDGVAPCDGDCDDASADVYPGAPEVCDGIADNDCNGQVDPLELDLDGDGWTVCQGDCDDGNAALELDDDDADGWNTCEGDCDDNDADLNLADADADGFDTCEGDCDDGNAAVFPGAAEVCGDGVDDDCDGVADDGCMACDITVPGDHATIAGAISASQDGDIVCVSAGTYYETIDFNGRDIEVVSVGGASVTTIDGNGYGPVVTFDSGETADAVLDGFTITGGDFTTEGAGIYVSAEPTLRNLVVDDNRASNFGGGLLLEGDAALDNVEVTGNEAPSGGGVYIRDSSPTFVDCLIDGNEALDFGGGLSADSATLTMTGVTISNNSTDVWDGGGLYAYDSFVMLSECTIDGNVNGGGGTGGGLGVEYSQLTMFDSVVSNNLSTQSGGGIHAYFTDSVLDRVLLSGNYNSAGSGAGMYIHYAELWASNMAVVGNVSDHYAGGLITYYDAELENVLFASNDAYWEAGGYDVGGGTVEISNGVFAGNTSNDGAGLAVWGATVSIENTIIAGNEATGDGGGVHTQYSTQLELINTILVENYASGDGGGVYSSGGSIDVSYSNAWHNTPENYFYMADPTGSDGNVSVDPLFIDTSPADPADWNLHLQLASSLIDAGDPTVRDPDNSTSDMGAYGGDHADLWDLDQDYYYEWWQPGDYDPITYPGMNLDCDDGDPAVYPGQGC